MQNQFSNVSRKSQVKSRGIGGKSGIGGRAEGIGGRSRIGVALSGNNQMSFGIGGRHGGNGGY